MRPGLLDNLTPIVKNLLIVNILVFVSLYLFQGKLDPYFLLFKVDLIFPRDPNFLWSYINHFGWDTTPDKLFKPLQLVTCFFSHKEIWHIFMNMYFLVSLGPAIEMVLYPRRFLEFYLFTGVLASILIALFDPSPVPVLGASTALSGVLVAFGYYYPNAKLGILFIPVQFTARKFVIGVAVISVLLFVWGLLSPGGGGGVSHFGHLMGMLSGFIYLFFESFKKKFFSNR